MLKIFFFKKKIEYLSLYNFYIKPKNFIIEILTSFIIMIFSFYKINKILNTKNIDIVLCHGIQSAIVVQIVMFFCKKKVKFYYMHRILKHYRYYDFFSKIIYKRFKLILCNSKAVKKSLYPFCEKKKLKVVYNAVEINYNLKFKKGKKNILSIARFEKRKNLIFLIKAFTKFHNKKNGYNLILLGDGPEKENLLDFIKKNNIKNVKFIGYKKNIKKYLEQCEIFVHTSLFEGMSNAVLEAMSMGKPSIVLNSPGVSELHIHKKTGFISSNNVNEFANYIYKLVNNIKLQNFFFKNSMKRVEDNYSINKTLISYNKYLK